jgi:membrane fusion protein (multidrug efflux system)
MKKAVCLVPVLSLLAVAAGLGCEKERAKAKNSRPQPVAVAEVKATHPFVGTITRWITLPAEIKADREVTLYAKVTGYLRSITVDKGDEVAEGALLAEIEVPELIADAAKFKAEVNLANVEYQRVSEARKKAPDLVVPLTIDMAKSKAEVAKANLERADTLLGFTRITAPFAGIVTERTVDAGAFIPAATSASPQNAALLRIADFRRVRVRVGVPEGEASLIRRGESVKVSAEGLRGKVFKGEVTRFSYSLDELTKTMLAEIELPNPNLELRPGMYAKASIGLEDKKDALLVPAGAVVTEKVNSFVFTLVENRAHKTPVRTGFADGDNVEILGGLNPGDTLVIPPRGGLSDGQAVRAAEGS